MNFSKSSGSNLVKADLLAGNRNKYTGKQTAHTGQTWAFQPHTLRDQHGKTTGGEGSWLNGRHWPDVGTSTSHSEGSTQEDNRGRRGELVKRGMKSISVCKLPEGLAGRVFL